MTRDLMYSFNSHRNTIPNVYKLFVYRKRVCILRSNTIVSVKIVLNVS